MSRKIQTSSARWRRVRRRVLRRDRHLCQCCRKAVAYTVDHIIPAAELSSAAAELDASNLQSICVPCHKHKSAEEAFRRADIVQDLDVFSV